MHIPKAWFRIRNDENVEKYVEWDWTPLWHRRHQYGIAPLYVGSVFRTVYLFFLLFAYLRAYLSASFPPCLSACLFTNLQFYAVK